MFEVDTRSGVMITHPFVFDNLLFSHNGYIENFETSIRSNLLGLLDKKLLSKIKGSTDSELIFLIIINIYKKEKSLLNAIKEAIKILSKVPTD